MIWALIAITEQWMLQCINNEWVNVLVPPGTVLNSIVYNGTDPYTPPQGSELKQIPNTYQIGDYYPNY